MAEASVAQQRGSFAEARLTREQRGVALYRERGEEIENQGFGKYSVPGCSEGEYEVDLKVSARSEAGEGAGETCTCPDFEHYCQERDINCKHIYAATIYRAKHRKRCAECGKSSAHLSNGHEKGWDAPFYCRECNPRSEAGGLPMVDLGALERMADEFRLDGGPA